MYMKERIKLFFYYFLVGITVLLIALVIASVATIIQEKSFSGVFEFSQKDGKIFAVIMVAIVCYALIMSIVSSQMWHKPMTEKFCFENEAEKIEIMNKVDSVLLKSNRSLMDRKTKIQNDDNTITYSTNIKLIDYLTGEFVMNIHENDVELTVPSGYMKQVDELINS